MTVDRGRDPARLRRYFEAFALNSTGLADHKTIYDAAGVNRRTALAYERLLQNLMVVDHLPAWTSNQLTRLTRAPKRILVDSSLLGGTLGVDTNTVLRDGDLLGRPLDTFVTAHLRAEATVADTRPRLYHARQAQGRHEIDVVVELAASESSRSGSSLPARQQRATLATCGGSGINSQTDSSVGLYFTLAPTPTHSTMESLRPRFSPCGPDGNQSSNWSRWLSGGGIACRQASQPPASNRYQTNLVGFGATDPNWTGPCIDLRRRTRYRHGRDTTATNDGRWLITRRSSVRSPSLCRPGCSLRSNPVRP